MSRLPPALQPLWPVAKRLHRLAARVLGLAGRAAGPLLGEQRLPRTGSSRSSSTAAECGSAHLHAGPPVPHIRREPPGGDPAEHWSFGDATDVALPDRYVLELQGGLVVGDYGAVVTAEGVLDYETSEYFGIRGWREHPIFLRGRLPRVEEVDGSLAVLATRGGSDNYYHFLFDVLPRWAVLEQTAPDLGPDALYVPTAHGYQRELLALVGLDRIPAISTGKHRVVRGQLLVPSLPNPREVMPPWVVSWLRERLLPADIEDRPRRLYVTRGMRPNTRRLTCEPQLLPELRRRGFAVVDPGTMSVREQIAHFAAAEVVVAPHGAGLSNLVFSPPGVKVLHLMAPAYVKHCFWAILDSVPGSTYRYLVGEGVEIPPGRPMQGIQDDIRISPERVLAELDALVG